MIATDFTRDDCRVGNMRRSYDELRREWRCNECGGRLVMICDDDGWKVVCGNDHDHRDFVHEYELKRQQREAERLLESLPPELAELYG